MLPGVEVKAAPAPGTASSLGRRLRRLLGFIVLAFVIGFLLKQLALRLEANPDPAGFGRGLLQGAMMPAAMPTLLVGVDVPIYAVRNTGVPYKLGYTMGVTACGALFFGLFFRRLRTIRRWV